MAASEEFAVGEHVLVPFTDKYYPAKIIKAEYRTTDPRFPDGSWFYFLHYSGWNKKFDEWVEASGLARPGGAAPIAAAAPPPDGGGGQVQAGPRSQPRKLLKDRFQKKRPLGAAEAPAAVGGAVGEGTAPGAAFSGGGALSSAVHLELDIPPTLKKALLDDFDAIVSDAKLSPLPRHPSVADVLRKYCEDAAEANGGANATEEEVAHALRTYFDKSLMAILLYRTERPQALSALADGRLPSVVYGTEHLLRLLLKLPELLGAAGAASFTEQQLLETANAVQDLVYWLADNLDTHSLLMPKDHYLDYQAVMERLQAGGPSVPNGALAAAAAAALAAAAPAGGHGSAAAPPAGESAAEAGTPTPMMVDSANGQPQAVA